MSFAASIADALPVLRWFCEVCLIGAFLGCVFTVIECGFLLTFGRPDSGPHSVEPPVTVLKPLHATEPELEMRLGAFCRQDYAAPIQVLCGAQDQAAGAAAVRAIQCDAPDRTIELAIDTRNHGVNRKVSNLINMLPHARHDTLVISDADIVVEPDYLRGVTALLAAPARRRGDVPLPRHRRRPIMGAPVRSRHQHPIPAASDHRDRPQAGKALLRCDDRLAPLDARADRRLCRLRRRTRR